MPFGRPGEAPDYDAIAAIAAKKPAAQAQAPKTAQKAAQDPFSKAKSAGPAVSVSPRAAAQAAVYVLLAASLWYAFGTHAWTKAGRIPTERADVAVLQANLSKQKAELAALRGGSAVDPADLARKESLLAAWLPSDGPKLRLRQADVLWQVAAKAGLNVENFQKVEDQRDDYAVEKAGSGAEALGIANPFERVWYVKYSIDSSSSEAAILRFKELVESHPALSVDSFSVMQAGDGLRYNVVVKAYYIVNQEG